MINKIICGSFFVCALFALSLAVLGVEGPIQLAPSFRAFIVNCNLELDNFRIAIPNINFRFDTVEIGEFLESNNIITVFVEFVKGFYGFLNFLIEILNFIVMAINTLISLLQFIFILIKNLITFREDIIVNVTSLIN